MACDVGPGRAMHVSDPYVIHMNTMFKRKLEALGYGRGDLDIRDETHWRNFIIWIEDMKIRFYAIEDRESLRKSTGEQWIKTYEQYLKDIVCPYIGSDRATIAEWLLGHAVRLEYAEQVDKYKAVSVESTVKGASSEDPFKHLNPEDPNFKAGLASICRLLKMPEHYDQEVTLRGVSVLIRQRLSKEALEDESLTSQEGSKISLEDCPLGFDTGDKNLNEAAKILRLLHVNELRELQTRINEAIVCAQSVTANPKTDERLGKVGR
ncbi:RNA transcription, translation and transport factor protein-like [Anneissia japonica]|uniref:RNA transcription, translation and transport factor protein-like n=1 Tax=Anneissia japonica TaxID=1529436 RepID=UPI0014255215|nr:RNA transcription, translation and transport factor protein-like [Anneissia japonica]